MQKVFIKLLILYERWDEIIILEEAKKFSPTQKKKKKKKKNIKNVSFSRAKWSNNLGLCMGGAG